MLLMILYLVILAVLSFLILRNMVKDKDLFRQIEALLVLIPFLLRLLLIK